MTKDELIAKQQIEIEELKIQARDYRQAIADALDYLHHPEQWSMKCPDFPKVAMRGILGARDALNWN